MSGQRKSRSTGLHVLLGVILAMAIQVGGSSAARASAEADDLRCASRTARVEARFLTCAKSCRTEEAGDACEASCTNERNRNQNALADRGCVDPQHVPFEVSPHHGAIELGCRARSESARGRYLGCAAGCESRTTAADDDVDPCAARCATTLTERLAKLTKDGACDMLSEPRSDVAAPAAYARTSSVWKSPRIKVCWLNPKSSNRSERSWVESAVRRTWENVSNVDFVGWGQCRATDLFWPNGSGGPIKIYIKDGTPNVSALGRGLSWTYARMELNFTFKKWSTSCQSKRSSCIRSIAVHEFGHALGFAHEQNRPDTPPTCNERQGSNGTMRIGAWDMSSVMNYCNQEWNNGGRLSSTDVQGVQKLYGAELSTYERRTDFYGRDYRSFRPARARSSYCRNACLADERCAAWTYVAPKTSGGNAACWLKSSVPSPRYNSRTTSGVINTIEPKTDYYGGDYKKVALASTDTPEACRQACVRESRCRAWTYLDAKRWGERPGCWLKDQVNRRSSKSTTTSGRVGAAR